MTIHTTPPPGGTDNTDPAAEPPHRPRRFTGERGIALQTVIIMVVMLAIAGGIAAVLLTRGQQASEQLEGQATGVAATTYTNKSFCENAGLWWEPTANSGNGQCQYPDVNACTKAGGNDKDTDGTPLATGDTCQTSGGKVLGEVK